MCIQTWVQIQPRPLVSCVAMSKEGAALVRASVSPPETGTVTAALRDRAPAGPGAGPPWLRLVRCGCSAAPLAVQQTEGNATQNGFGRDRTSSRGPSSRRLLWRVRRSEHITAFSFAREGLSCCLPHVAAPDGAAPCSPRHTCGWARALVSGGRPRGGYEQAHTDL